VNWLLQVLDPASIGAFFAQVQADMQTPAFWLAVGKIIWINVLLSGDNALVIAMACRGLAPGQRLWGMVIGAGVAVVLLISFTGIVAKLMVLPYLKLVGGVALLVIAAKLLVPEDEGDDVTAGTSLWHAIRIVVIADIVMSLDNVIAVAAAANGQFLMMRRDVYDSIGGHSSVAGEVLEDVALAMRVKAAGHRIWFSSGKGIVCVRMYRSFQAMWQGWKKNLYRLMGGTPGAVFREMESSLPWIPLLLIVAGLKYPFLLFLGVLFLIARQTGYGFDLARNHFPFSFIFYYVPAVALYVAVLWASYRDHVKGRIQWKGREYSVVAPQSAR